MHIVYIFNVMIKRLQSRKKYLVFVIRHNGFTKGNNRDNYSLIYPCNILYRVFLSSLGFSRGAWHKPGV